MNDRITARRLPKKLFTYISLEFFIPFAYCIVGFWGLFILMDLLDALKNLMELDASILQISAFLITHQLVNLKFILPMSLLIAASFMMHRLSRHGETIAIRASGTSLITACMPIWFFALVLSICTAYLNEQVRPLQAMKTEEALQKKLASENPDNDIHHTLAYTNRAQDRNWFFKEFKKGGPYTGVRVKQFREDNSIRWEIHAKRAAYRSGTWIFKDGKRTHYKRDELLPSEPSETFEQYRADNLSETPEQITGTLRTSQTMSTPGILKTLSTNSELPHASNIELRTMLAHRLSFPFACLMGALVGIGFAVSWERGSTLKGFATSIGIIMLYYFIDQAAFTLGRIGYIPAFAGGALPTVLFITIGTVRMIKVR